MTSPAAAPLTHGAGLSADERGTDGSTRESSWGADAPRRIIGTAILAIGLAVLGGALAGAVWGAFAPRVLAVVSETAISASEEQTGRTFAAEGVYAVIMVVAGIATAVAGRGWMRSAGPFAILGLAAAGVVGSLVAWRVGVWVGPDPIETLTGLTVGQSIEVPLTLRSRGLLLTWPIATVFLLLWISALTVEPGAHDGSGGGSPLAPGARSTGHA